MQFFANANYDAIKWRYHWLTLSLAIIIAGGVAWFVNGINLGIDFAGGASVIVQFQEQPPLDQLRGVVKDATIQRYGPAEQNSVLIRLPKQETEGDYAGQLVEKLHQTFNPDAGQKIDLNYQGTEVITNVLADADPDHKGSGPEATAYYDDVVGSVIGHRSELGLYKSFDQVRAAPKVTPAVANVLQEKTFLGKFNVRNQETVGPQVGRELQRKAFWAILLSTIAMGIYVAVRFDLKFGVAAIICLLHDVMVTLSFQLITGIEFSIVAVAAYLTLVGYSINDTVVVYDRVRENLRKQRTKTELKDILNLSINQTLSRTILTSGFTLLALICLIIWGGEVLAGFAWLMFMGILVGTYSSIVVAPAVALWWEKYISKDKRTYAGRRAQSASSR